jgi:hypothetical protein
VRAALRVLGTLLGAAGLLFAAQGAELFPYPRESFMIGASTWIWRGAALAAAGALLLVLASRRGAP